MNDRPSESHEVTGVGPARLPRHVAIIMDGNGRWANARGWPRIAGHDAGAKTVRRIVTHAARLNLETLTLYSFSSENWSRPGDEVEFLMDLYRRYLIAERDTILGNNVRFKHLGRRVGLPDPVLVEMDRTVEMSRANTGLTLCLALNYGARDEIVDAVRELSRGVLTGRFRPEEIDEAAISAALYTAGLPDPDLLIRTAGEQRLSNFLLWQISYAELHVCPRPWPDFTEEDFNAAIRDFGSRKRRFGGVCDPPEAPTASRSSIGEFQGMIDPSTGPERRPTGVNRSRSATTNGSAEANGYKTSDPERGQA